MLSDWPIVPLLLSSTQRPPTASGDLLRRERGLRGVAQVEVAGQHALLRLVTYLAAAAASRQLDLSGAVPVAIFVFAMSIAYGLALVSTLSFFAGSDGPGLDFFGTAVAFAFVNVLAAGPTIAAVDRVVARFADEEVGRRGSIPLGYGPRRGLG